MNLSMFGTFSITISASLSIRRYWRLDVDGEHRREDEPLWHSADFGLIRVNGRDYRFVGTKHRRIVRQLVEAHQAGSPICLTAAVLAEAECGDSVNTLAKAFSGRQDWRDFIKEEAGNCWIAI